MPHVPFAGAWHGREAVGHFFRIVEEVQEIVAFEPQAYIAQGDHVVVLGQFVMRIKSTGCVFGSKWAHVWTVTGGQVRHFDEYVDTATVSSAHTTAQTGA